MDKAKRVLYNTLSQYIRTGLNVILSLYSTRIVMETLGEADYGLYSVIAGVVAMLSFVSNALIISTQRYLSYSHSQNDLRFVSKVFGNSLIIHLVISLCLLVLLLSFTNLVVTTFLDIPLNKIAAAKVVYICVVAMIALSFITSPFKALFIARENIVYISIIDVIDGVFKVCAALLLPFICFDKLESYAVLLVSISVFNLIAFGLYAFLKYQECHLPTISEIDKEYVKKLISFASWTLYSTGCVIVRTQGIAVIINRAFGVLVNASYGIAQQVSGALLNVSQAIANALSPQIIKAEGEGNREKMIYLASIECKYAYMMLAMVAIPLIFNMRFILELWLNNVPQNSVMFCNMVIIAAMCDTLTGGLGIANQAIGKIKVYSLIFGSLKLITLPIAYIAIRLIQDPLYVMLPFVIVEFISAIFRMFYLKVTAGLRISVFLKNVISPAICSTVVVIVVCYILNAYISWNYKIIILIPSAVLAAVLVAYFTMSREEKELVKRICRR